MFDFTGDDNPWENEPGWEDFLSIWIDYLSKCANYHGLSLVEDKLILPEGQNKAMLAVAKLRVLEAKLFLHETYPNKKEIIDRLPY